jgi:DNA-binding NarL/FixJ family response regulator
MEPIFKILIVEDHIPIREYLRDILTARFPSIAIEEAGNGDEVSEKLIISKPHFIFMDIGLPGKNGIELTREIKTSHPDIKIFILTGLGRSYEKAAYASGADGFLEKGITSLEEICGKIESSMAGFPPSTP